MLLVSTATALAHPVRYRMGLGWGGVGWVCQCILTLLYFPRQGGYTDHSPSGTGCTRPWVQYRSILPRKVRTPECVNTNCRPPS